MRRFMRCTGLWMPGVSKSTIWPPGRLTTARIRLRVVCGLSETMATFWPTSVFTSVDLPTLGRPTTETNPAWKPVPPGAGSPVNGMRRGSNRLLLGRLAAEAHAVDPLVLGGHDLH